MTVAEFEEAYVVDKKLLIHVKDHKGTKPAKLVVDGIIREELVDWMTTLRPMYVNGDTQYIFAEEDGRKIHKLSDKVSKIARQFSASVGTATSVRKAIATAGGLEASGDKTVLAQAMSHSVATADKYYRAYEDSVNIEGHGVIGKILNVSLDKKRQRFTTAQTAVIMTTFSDDIACGVIPNPPALEKFLSENRVMFLDRKG